MKNLLLIIILAYPLNSCTQREHAADQEARFIMPAEYEPHDFVWLGWEDHQPYKEPFISLAEVLIDHVPLRIVAADSSGLLQVKEALKGRQIDMANIEFYVFPDNRLWMRDHGATYVKNSLGEQKVVDFGWTLYGNFEYLKTYFNGNIDSAKYVYNLRLGQTGFVDCLMGSVDELATVKTDVNMEGGSIEVNGKGTLILSEQVTMQRNPEKSKKYLEAEFKRTLGVDHIIWMKKGLIEDPLWFNNIVDNYYGWGTYGHTDEYVRFINDSTILLAWVEKEEKDLNPINQINYKRMAENLEILQQAVDQDGNPFNIIKVPLPDLIYTKTVVAESEANWESEKNWQVPIYWLPERGIKNIGDSINRVASSSYLNYLVTNDVVILPTYLSNGSSPKKEEKVKSIFKEAFPGRELVFLEFTDINYFGGGIHCITQQQPW